MVSGPRPTRAGAAAQRGVSYLALLLAVAITNGALAAGATVWSQWQRRERETQLLWAGDQIRRAIVAYAQAAGAPDAAYPRSLQDLLLDPRTPQPRRFLRQIYADPMALDGQWGLIYNPQGRLIGVYSQARGVPAKRARFATPYAEFEGAGSYAQWRFAAVAQPVAALPAPAQPGARSASAAGPRDSGPAAVPAAPPAEAVPEPMSEPEPEPAGTS